MPRSVKPGQIWLNLKTGHEFKIEKIVTVFNGDKFAEYWLDRGSKQQFRTIRLDRMIKGGYKFIREG